MSVQKSAKILIKPRFDSPILWDTIISPSAFCYALPSINSTLVSPHLSDLVFTDLEYMAKSHIEVLMEAMVYTRIVEGAFINGNLKEPPATPSALAWLSAETPFIGTYRATHNSSSETFKNWYTGEFSEIICFLQVKTTVEPLYKYRRKKRSMRFLHDHPTEWGRAKVRLSPFHDQLILRFWVDLFAAFQRLDWRMIKIYHFSHVQKYGC